MTFQEFLNRYNGQMNVGNTPENKGQCVGLIQVWLANLLLPHVWGHAKDLLANADKNVYEVIYNTPIGVPKQGDTICWNSNMGAGFGHTAIVVKADVNTFEVFEQNNPIGSNCHLRTFLNYNNVQGWMRKKEVAPVESIPLLKQKIADLQQTEIRLKAEMGTLQKQTSALLADKDKVCQLKIEDFKIKIINSINSYV